VLFLVILVLSTSCFASTPFEVHSEYSVFLHNSTSVVAEVTVTGADPEPKVASVKPDETRAMSWHVPNPSTAAKARVEARHPDGLLMFCHV
jgi:hypothetical protein